MVGNTLVAALMVSVVAVVCSNPVHQPEQSNVHQCAQPKVSGMCLAYFPSYYYNAGTESCESFIYGGCQGNQNRFSTEQECLSTCGGFKHENIDFTLRPEYDEEELVEKSKEVSTEDPCSLKQEMGPCRANMARFYFNGDECERFVYGGCQGNGNNFKTVDECQKRCGSTSSAEETDSSENETKDSSEEKSEEKSTEEKTEE